MCPQEARFLVPLRCFPGCWALAGRCSSSCCWSARSAADRIWPGGGSSREFSPRPSIASAPSRSRSRRLPAWIHSDIRGEVFRDPKLGGPLSIMDDDLVDRIKEAFAEHPWVAKVSRRHASIHPALRVGEGGACLPSAGVHGGSAGQGVGGGCRGRGVAQRGFLAHRSHALSAPGGRRPGADHSRRPTLGRRPGGGRGGNCRGAGRRCGKP